MEPLLQARVHKQTQKLRAGGGRWIGVENTTNQNCEEQKGPYRPPKDLRVAGSIVLANDILDVQAT